MALLRAAIRTFRNERDDNCIPRRPSNWWNDSFLVCRREKKNSNELSTLRCSRSTVVHKRNRSRVTGRRFSWLKSRGNFRENESLPFIELTLPSLLGSLISNRRKFWFNVWKYPSNELLLLYRLTISRLSSVESNIFPTAGKYGFDATWKIERDPRWMHL